MQAENPYVNAVAESYIDRRRHVPMEVVQDQSLTSRSRLSNRRAQSNSQLETVTYGAQAVSARSPILVNDSSEDYSSPLGHQRNYEVRFKYRPKDNLYLGPSGMGPEQTSSYPGVPNSISQIN